MTVKRFIRQNETAVTMIALFLFFATIIICCEVFIGSPPAETSDERFDRQQQERFAHEREQQDIKDAMKLRELSNKIKSGYYD